MNKQQKYWSNPRDRPNKPKAYVKKELNYRSAFLYFLMQEKLLTSINNNDSILEIGCNAGRNLNYLFERNFSNLFGIEINEKAVELMKKTYPRMYEKSNILINSIESVIPLIRDNNFNVVISFAVLMHLPFESNFIMKEITRITKDYLIIVEDERQLILGDRHFPRDYKDIFENMGFEEVASGKCPMPALKDYTWRILKKK